MELVGSQIGEENATVKNLCCVDEIGDLLLFEDLKNVYGLDNPLIDFILLRLKNNGILETLSSSSPDSQLACKTAVNLSSILGSSPSPLTSPSLPSSKSLKRS